MSEATMSYKIGTFSSGNWWYCDELGWYDHDNYRGDHQNFEYVKGFATARKKAIALSKKAGESYIIKRQNGYEKEFHFIHVTK